MFSLFSFAQEGFVTSGGDASTGTGSVSFSVGQLAYNAYGNTSFLIIEGLQQPYEMSALPISLLYFSAKANPDRTVNLNWSTTSEYNSDYFTIERSKDGVHFDGLRKIPSAGNSNTRKDYTTIDDHPYEGSSYYRLKQTDKDDKSTLSKIERVYFGDTQFFATVAPNPARDEVQLRIDGTINNKWSYRLTDMSGKDCPRTSSPIILLLLI